MTFSLQQAGTDNLPPEISVSLLDVELKMDILLQQHLD